ncbi:MAG TPA: hypothetical protein VKA78_15615 [Pyrinomonadaceae bacterium]|nr:hypothetical protein [Pyrinomonadaceae bacterium]
MREFTKSMTSYTWAMSLFGLQQMVNVFRPGKATESFNNVTKATEDEFTDALKATFRAGDNLQKGLVDLTFGVLTLGMFDRGGARATSDVTRQTGEAFRQGGRLVNQTVDAVNQTVQSATSAAAGAAQQSAEWAATASMANDVNTRSQREAGPGPASRPSGGTSGGRPQGWGPMPTQGQAGK